MSAQRFVCIHGHFYQPPRENPWLEAIEVQDSAAPFHDWNERVSAECYRPNAAARVLDTDGYIRKLRNNYADISFNFGPTLLSWLERAQPDVYAAIQAADRDSLARLGHGNAIAQVYGHAIMPLASRRDQITQVRWGIADFVHRFGRPPRGMWLPETAVDVAALRVLAQHGMRFTILAPGQAARIRLAGGEWQEVNGDLDTSRAYRCDLGDGRSIILFFYDGALAHAVAFGGLLNDGHALARQIAERAEACATSCLVHYATDGESYGHHHRFGEMALAAAIDDLDCDGIVALTNYAAFLERVPVTDSVEIHENSSWSCAHGVERWRSHCGCNAGHPDWQQEWRAPLRRALDWLGQQLGSFFEHEARRYLRDPWEARNAYIEVILKRDRERRNAFLHQHGRHNLHGRERSDVWKLLEMQRYGLLSFTSCGWFFDEPSGLETVQILTYAARAMQLAGELGRNLEPEFLHYLGAVRSNLSQYKDGADLYEQSVRPLVSDGRRIIAQYAMRALFEAPPAESHSYIYRIHCKASVRESSGAVTLIAGRARLICEATEDSCDYEYVTLYLGGHDIQCAVAAADVNDDGSAQRAEIVALFRTANLAELVRHIDRRYAHGLFTAKDLFVAERRKLLAHITANVRAVATREYEQIVDDNRRLIEFLTHAGEPIPHELQVAAGFVLQRKLEVAAQQFVQGEGPAAQVATVLGEAQRWKIQLDLEPAAQRFSQGIADAIATLVDSQAAGVARVNALFDAATELAVQLDLRTAQDRFYALWERRADAERLPAVALKQLAERLRFHLPERPSKVRAA